MVNFSNSIFLCISYGKFDTIQMMKIVIASVLMVKIHWCKKMRVEFSCEYAA